MEMDIAVEEMPVCRRSQALRAPSVGTTVSVSRLLIKPPLHRQSGQFQSSLHLVDQQRISGDRDRLARGSCWRPDLSAKDERCPIWLRCELKGSQQLVNGHQ
jgi:hypothetical protein